MKNFSEIFDLNDINYSIWKSIIERTLCVNIESNQKNDKFILRYKNIKSKEQNIKTFEYKKGNEFNGIIKYLTDTTGGNIHKNETIQLSSNNIYSSDYLPENVLDFNNNNIHYSSSKIKGNDAWICFDFKDKKIEITQYSIRSRNGGKNDQNLKSWVFEISDDGNKWIVIDEHQNCPTLNGKLFYATFDTNIEKKSFSRYFRIRQTGETWGDGDLEIESVEIFGKIQLKSE